MNDYVKMTIGEVLALYPKGTPAGDAAQARLDAERRSAPRSATSLGPWKITADAHRAVPGPLDEKETR